MTSALSKAGRHSWPILQFKACNPSWSGVCNKHYITNSKSLSPVPPVTMNLRATVLRSRGKGTTVDSLGGR